MGREGMMSLLVVCGRDRMRCMKGGGAVVNISV